MTYKLLTYKGDVFTLKTSSLASLLKSKEGGLIGKKFLTVNHPVFGECLIHIDSVDQINPTKETP